MVSSGVTCLRDSRSKHSLCIPIIKNNKRWNRLRIRHLIVELLAVKLRCETSLERNWRCKSVTVYTKCVLEPFHSRQVNDNLDQQSPSIQRGDSPLIVKRVLLSSSSSSLRSISLGAGRDVRVDAAGGTKCVTSTWHAYHRRYRALDAKPGITGGGLPAA